MMVLFMQYICVKSVITAEELLGSYDDPVFEKMRALCNNSKNVKRHVFLD